jgi:hypothetical protein
VIELEIAVEIAVEKFGLHDWVNGAERADAELKLDGCV